MYKRQVEALCQRLGVELLSEQADVAALSRQRYIGEELAGRQARYDLFEKAVSYTHLDVYKRQE